MPKRKQNGWECEGCGIEFTIRKLLVIHKKKCSKWIEKKQNERNKSKKEYICPGCEAKNSGQQNHIEHMRVCERWSEVKKDHYKISNVENSRKAAESLRGDVKKRDAWREKISKNVSKSILSNENELKRRRELFSFLNEKYKDIYNKNRSETAIRTSSRKDILDKRSENLRRWRENNPEDFYKKCTSKMIKRVWFSAPEKYLKKILSEYGFKHSQTIKNKKFTTKSKRRQIDFLNRDEKMIVEFDGQHHFEVIKKYCNNLEYIRKKDNELNDVMTGKGYLVIRISHDAWSPSNKRIKVNYLKILLDTINGGNRKCLMTIGKKYQ